MFTCLPIYCCYIYLLLQLLHLLLFLQVLSFIRENKGMAEHLFKLSNEKLNAKKVVSILKPSFAPVGNNRRQAQEIIMAKFVAFLKSAEGNANYLKAIH